MKQLFSCHRFPYLQGDKYKDITSSCERKMQHKFMSVPKNKRERGKQNTVLREAETLHVTSQSEL